MTDRRKGPILIEMEGDTPVRRAPEPARDAAPMRGASGGRLVEDLPADAPSPADVPPVADADLPQGQAMRRIEALSVRPKSRLWPWALGLGTALVGFVASYAFWEFVTALIARNAVLGWAALALAGAFAAVVLAIVLREWLTFARLGRLDRLQHRAAAAHAAGDLKEARAVAREVAGLYAGRPTLGEGRRLVLREAEELIDADAVLASAERRLLGPLDAAALREVEAASRQVAIVTAFVPLAFADVAAALTANVRMIRRVAETYGGRSGTLGNWRLAGAVFTHLAATGAVAAGDDLVHSALGGNLLARLSRRFGEGLVNGALTARVGVAAMEVCRPLPFRAAARPSVTAIIGRSLSGLFDKDGRRA